MPPKQQKGKKAVATKKKQLIEDKTFGLKNKNKSKSVQKYISTVQKSVNSTAQQIASDAAKNKKMASKEAKKAQEAELAALFDEALLTGGKKGSVAKKGKASEAVAVETKAKVIQETIIIEEGEKTLEDRIEEQRAKLHREGKQGTPVNQETLAKWKADRKAKKIAEERRKVQAEMKKKSKGKGLSVLSGRALYDYDATLFADDADAVDNDTMKQRNDEDEGEGEGEGEGERKEGEEEKEGAPGGERGGAAAAGAGAAGAAAAAGVEVKEALFEGDDEDLDDLDDEEGS